MRRIKVNFMGREREAILVERPYRRKMRRRQRGKKYEWVEQIVQVYIPRELWDHPFLLIPLEPDEVGRLCPE